MPFLDFTIWKEHLNLERKEGGTSRNTKENLVNFPVQRYIHICIKNFLGLER